MGRYRNKRSSRPFIQVFCDVVDSPAWANLSLAARCCYIHLLRDKRRGDQVEFILTQAQGEKLMAKATFTRAMRELKRAGFITLHKPGGLGSGPAVYHLSSEWRDNRELGAKGKN